MEHKERAKIPSRALLDGSISFEVYTPADGKDIAMGNSGGGKYCA
jgi:hypothetical protein